MPGPTNEKDRTQLFANADPFENEDGDQGDPRRTSEARLLNAAPEGYQGVEVEGTGPTDNDARTASPTGSNAYEKTHRNIEPHRESEVPVRSGGSNNSIRETERQHLTIIEEAKISESSSSSELLRDKADDIRSEAAYHRSDVLQTTKTAADGPVVGKVKSTAHKFHLDSIRATGPSRLFNPTNIRMRVRVDDGPYDSDLRKRQELALLWRSRDNRKGRNSIAVPALPSATERTTPGPTSHATEVGKNLWRLCTTFPYWDMAFWSGWSYTIGSALFVIDGAFSFGPLASPSTEFTGETTYGGPLCFFIGTLFYQIGAVMAYLEAVNDGSFHGSAMRRLLEGHDEEQKNMLDGKLRSFFGNLVPHHNVSQAEKQAEDAANTVDPEVGWRTKESRYLRPGSIYPADKAPAPRRGGVDYGGEEGESSTYLTWRWWPSWRALRTHHVYEIGFLACAIQLFGVTLYGVTGIVVLPGVLSSLAPWQELGAFWVPQIVAAACFLIASIMFTLETQEKWWKPEPAVLGWWIGVWSIVGSVGFELSAAFGTASLYTGSWAEYQADLSSMWGSAAYLFGSFMQWYEALNKNPIEELFGEPGEMKSWQVHPI
ncbi:hypothetical protein LTR85_000127 [Meristemomyces frigidus]|nr:hypothetical protein LTR85_000127 [Meristemomyces frigidus]